MNYYNFKFISDCFCVSFSPFILERSDRSIYTIILKLRDKVDIKISQTDD